jgi:Zn-dependent protease with chaperone function
MQTTLSAEESKQVHKAISSRLQDDLRGIESPYEKEIKEIYVQRTRWLLEMISKESFIYDPVVLNYFDFVLKNILDNNPAIRNSDVRILINRSPRVNAYCTGEGTIIINLGLLRRIENESQLAFVISHELAHQELDHAYKGLQIKLEGFRGKETKRKEKEIRKSDRSVNIQQLELYKEILYSESKDKRSFEIEADSLGHIFMANTVYDQQQAISFLYMLDSSDYPKYPNYAEIDSIFNFSNFPFDPAWLYNEDSLFDMHFNPSIAFNMDSLKSHPDIDKRVEYLEPRLDKGQRGKVDIQHRDTLEWIVRMCDFEVIEGAYFTKDYSRCLFLTLQAMSVYPDNSYLHAMIGRIFIDLFEIGEHPAAKKYLFGSAAYYEAGMSEIRTFLMNLKQWEIGKIALNYINTKGNFDPNDESHYFVLWKIGKMINNYALVDRIEQAYLGTFPNGEYADEFSKKKPWE